MPITPSLTQGLVRGLVSFFSRHPVFLVICLIGYLILPIDLVPEAFFGPLGYIDDLIVLILPVLLREYARKLKHSDAIDTTAK